MNEKSNMPTEIRYTESMKSERQLFEDQSSECAHDGDLNEAMATKNRGRSGAIDRGRFQEKESMPKIERIRLKNFKVFKDIEMRDIPRFSVLEEVVVKREVLQLEELS